MPARLTLLPLQQQLIVEDGETLLDAGLRAGLNLPHSCKGGHCGSCRARLVQGSIAYPNGRPLGLSADEERGGHALLCQARAASEDLTVEIRQVRPPSLEPQVKSLPCRVERMQPLAPDVMAVTLRLPANDEFVFLAGQYVDIMLPGNRRRSFSIASPPPMGGNDGRELELHIRRVAGGEFTQALFAGMKEKTLLRIEGPLGQFWFRDDSSRPALLIGGGTGFAPLRAIIKQRVASGDDRPMHLYWGARTQVDLYENAAIQKLADELVNFSYTPVLSAADPAQGWTGRTGWVHEAVMEDHPQLAAFDVYVSGPPALVEAARRDFTAHGLPAGQFFFDSFDYAPR